MRHLTAYLLFVVGVCLYAAQASAGCTCQCVNGQMQPVCYGSGVPPVCGFGTCPQPGLSSPPVVPGPAGSMAIGSPVDRPVGTSTCQLAQVFNSYSGQYEWRRLCE